MNTHPALQAYLTAVAGRDLPSLMPLISPEVTLILPQGQLISGKPEFEDFHREWFSDPDWTLQADLVRATETPKTAVFVLSVVYLDKDRAGNPVSYSYLLSLVFAATGNRWSLVLDQNTPIHP